MKTVLVIACLLLCIKAPAAWQWNYTSYGFWENDLTLNILPNPPWTFETNGTAGPGWLQCVAGSSANSIKFDVGGAIAYSQTDEVASTVP